MYIHEEFESQTCVKAQAKDMSLNMSIHVQVL